MTDDEWLARRKRIQDAVIASNNRVKDFIELVAAMCVERTASKPARSFYDSVSRVEANLEEDRHVA
jgi:hypothetical protein